MVGLGDMDKWMPPRVLENLTLFGKDNADGLARVLFFLCKEVANPRYLQILGLCVDNIISFNGVVQQMLDDIARLDQDKNFINIMGAIWEMFILPYPKTPNGAADLEVVIQNPELSGFAARFLNVIALLPVHAQGGICDVMSSASTVMIGTCAVALSSINSLATKRVLVGVAVAYLSYDVWKLLCKWWRGEITGKRCIVLMGSSVSSVASGCAGVYLGSCVGAAIMPGVGAVVGGVVCGLAVGQWVERIADWLLRKVLGLPKQVAVENAYEWMSLKQDSSNEEINARFRELCALYSPEGEMKENWEKLQYQISVIRVSKEQSSSVHPASAVHPPRKVPKDVAVENAFEWMSLKQDSSIEEINARFRELCALYSQEGEMKENWDKLQSHFAMIKLSIEKQ